MSTSVASVTSHFPSAQDSFTTTLASTISAGATSVQLNSIAGYNNGEVAVFVVDPATPAKKQAFTGVIDTAGVQVTNVVWTEGNNQTHTSGATVVDYETATHWSMVAKGIKVAHNQDGTHKSGATYVLPVIADFTNAQHNHSNAGGGGNIPFAGLISTIFSGQVQTQVNAGTAGGTLWWVNLGGIKILWGLSALKANGTAGVPYTFTLPSFFTSVQTGFASIANLDTDARQSAAMESLSTASAQVDITAVSGTPNAKIGILIIGT